MKIKYNRNMYCNYTKQQVLIFGPHNQNKGAHQQEYYYPRRSSITGWKEFRFLI